MDQFSFKTAIFKLGFLLILVLSPTYLMSQANDSITLPAGNIEMKIYGPTVIFEIYVTKDQKVYFGNERLEYFDEICSLLKNKYRDRSISEDRKFAIIADINVHYKFIDKIKEQLGCYGIGRIYYKTGNLDDFTYLYNLLNGSTFQLENNERILTVEQENEYNELISDITRLPPPPPAELDYFVLMRTLHNGTKQEIEDWLKKYSFTSIWLIGNSKFRYKNEVIDYSDEDKIEGIILNPENLLIRYGENLTYGEYIRFMQIKYRLGIKHNINLNEKMIGELSLQAEERLERLGILIE
jgi:biopolymer transport protein ExbD